jgi:hypothetical protein
MNQSEAPAAAEIAHAVSECMNLLLLFAAPRILTTIRKTGLSVLSDKMAGATLRRFLGNAASIRARTQTITGDVERLIQAAIVVEEIAGALGTATIELDLPAPIIDRARLALSILGFPEPQGGWDAFEGFSIPLPFPPPPPRAG